MSTFHQLFPPWLDWLYTILDWPVNTGKNGGYLLWSGMGIGFFWPLIYWRKHNCHAPWCLRLGKHSTADGLHVLCRSHHPDLARKANLSAIRGGHEQARISQATRDHRVHLLSQSVAELHEKHDRLTDAVSKR